MNYSVSFDASSLIAGLQLDLEKVIGEAVKITAEKVQGRWQEAIYHVSGVRAEIKDRYRDSVKYQMSANKMEARIYSDDPMAVPIETGIPARDLKLMLDTSLKTRVAKQGKHAGQRYMIIPFRHNTPGHDAHAKDMPASVYAQAKQMKKSTVTKMSFRPNQLGVRGFTGARTHQLLTVPSRSYQWGDRLPSGLAPKLKDHHATDIYAGMVRFNTSSGKQKSSAYMTFRVMGEWSTGWIVPAQPGRYIVKGLTDDAQKILESEVQAAIAAVAGS